MGQIHSYGGNNVFLIKASVLILFGKTSNFWSFSERSFSRFNKTKTKTNIKNLRHRSLNVIVKYTHRKFQEVLWEIKRDIHVQKGPSI